MAILETLRCLKEQNLPHGDIQVIFSVSEEQGCAGIKNLDTALLHADMGFALDSSGRPGKLFMPPPVRIRFLQRSTVKQLTAELLRKKASMR